eukprot:SAG11_NODE_6256_length_1351_cov_1.095048_2_plen_174_part_00
MTEPLHPAWRTCQCVQRRCVEQFACLLRQRCAACVVLLHLHRKHGRAATVAASSIRPGRLRGCSKPCWHAKLTCHDHDWTSPRPQRLSEEKECDPAPAVPPQLPQPVASWAGCVHHWRPLRSFRLGGGLGGFCNATTCAYRNTKPGVPHQQNSRQASGWADELAGEQMDGHLI